MFYLYCIHVIHILFTKNYILIIKINEALIYSYNQNKQIYSWYWLKILWYIPLNKLMWTIKSTVLNQLNIKKIHYDIILLCRFKQK